MHEKLAAQSNTLNLKSIQTVTRSELLRETANTIIQLVNNKHVCPSDIAIVGPGLDSLARYALIEILEKANIPVTSLKVSSLSILG